MREQHAPIGYVSGRALATGLAFVTFEVVASVSGGEASGETLVCKRIRLAALEHPQAREQLLREGQVLERLAGRGAPRVVLAGEDERGPFVVMERVTAEPPSSLRAEDLAVACAARAAFGALCEVHEAADARGPLGIVHGDISPPNLLLSADRRRAWLIDFGRARGRDWPAPNDGGFAGTIAFAAPELARGEPIDARADLFAMSATLLSAAVGREPRPRGDLTLAAQLARAGEQPLDDFLADASSVVPSAVRALGPCLAFEASRRPPSARAVLDALATC